MTAGVFLLASGGPRAVGFTEGEFECEQAAAHLQGCCPDLDVTAINCNEQSGCGEVRPALFSKEASKCIQNTTCADARAICDLLSELDRAEETGPTLDAADVPGCLQ